MPAFSGFLLALLAGISAGTPSARADINLVNNTTVITGPIEVRLSFTDQNGTAQDVSLLSLPPSLANALPGSLTQLAKLPLLTAPGKGKGYFDQAWQQSRDAVCGEVAAEISQQVNSSSNQAYDVSCSTNSLGALLATVETQWQDSSMFTITGTRLTLDYWIPFNSSAFSSTSPTTCRNANLVCAADPQFTLLYDTHLTLTFSSPNLPTLALPPIDQHIGEILAQGISEGSNTGAIQAAGAAWVVGVGVTFAVNGTVGVLDLVAQSVQLAAQLAGLGVAVGENAHLRDTISAELLLNSPTAAATATAASAQFDAIFQGLAAAQSVGFSGLSVVAGADGSLIFRLSKPPAAKPVVHNVIAQSNSTPSLFRPVIGVDVQEVKPGDQMVVRGSNFFGAETTRIVISWDHTVSTEAATTEIDWGVEGGPVQKVSTNQGTFEFDNLQPATNYQFRVHECDPVTCAPWSDTLTVTTSVVGTDQALIWLDNASSSRIGTGTIDGSGSFSATVTVPAGTTPGQHTVHASTGQPAQLTPIIFPPLGPILGGGGLAVTNLRTLPANTAAASPAGTARPALSRVITPVAFPVRPVGVGNQNPVPINNPMGPASPSPQQATTTIMVCGASGCVPTISLINSATNTVQPAPGQVEDTFPFTLRGDGFSAGQPVNVFLDSPTGTKIGAATVAPSGTFQATFTMPSIQGGSHQFFAVETAGGKTVQASVPIFVQMLPQ